MISSEILASRVIFGTTSSAASRSEHSTPSIPSSSGGGGDSGGTASGVVGTARDWLTNKQIKISLLENDCSPAALKFGQSNLRNV